MTAATWSFFNWIMVQTVLSTKELTGATAWVTFDKKLKNLDPELSPMKRTHPVGAVPDKTCAVAR
jgi:hypothetical protein